MINPEVPYESCTTSSQNFSSVFAVARNPSSLSMAASGAYEMTASMEPVDLDEATTLSFDYALSGCWSPLAAE